MFNYDERKNVKMKYLIFLIMSLMTVSAQAEEAKLLKAAPIVGIGVTTSSVSFDDTTLEDMFGDKNTGFYISGGAIINDVVSFEAFYQKSDEKSKTSGPWVDEDGDVLNAHTKLSYEAYGVDAKLFIPTAVEGFKVFGTAGLAEYKFKGKMTSDYELYEPITETETERLLGYRLGVGAEYQLTKHISANLAGRVISFEDKTDATFDSMTELSVGIKYMF